jgi:hypothetical protein
MTPIQAKILNIIAYQMGWEREDKTIPMMESSVTWIHPVNVTVDYTIFTLFKWLGGIKIR